MPENISGCDNLIKYKMKKKKERKEIKDISSSILLINIWEKTPPHLCLMRNKYIQDKV
jgi:hypothetical protein